MFALLSKNRHEENRKIYFRSEFTFCPHCEKKLQRAHTAWHKEITTLNGVIEAWSIAYTCKNMICSHKGIFYKSAEAEMLGMKQSSYGGDVLSLAGEVCFTPHMTVSELTAALHVTTELNGGILLSMHGVQQKKGNETLHILYEVFSGTVIAAKNMESGTVAELQALILPVIKLGFPIVGIVFDGQYSLRLAFEGLLPGLPYQYCHYRYISTPIAVADRKLKKRLKNNMRAIRDFERKIEQMEKNISKQSDEADTSIGGMAEINLAKKYIAAARALLLEGGNSPPNLPGMLIYERAQAIQASLSRYLVRSD
ncbi:transposase [Paenibacillus algorifonticola]|uniref:transposase n=1 Tax=Paenibacillus algorifonticola TaxID=684063 RepID=UPI003D2E8F3E